MIKSFEHKGLQKFYETGNAKGINPQHARKLKMILQMLDVASHPTQLNVPGMRFHQLKGRRKGYFAVTVRANWRVIFKFEGEDAILVDYLDYH